MQFYLFSCGLSVCAALKLEYLLSFRFQAKGKQKWAKQNSEKMITRIFCMRNEIIRRKKSTDNRYIFKKKFKTTKIYLSDWTAGIEQLGVNSWDWTAEIEKRGWNS